MNKILHSFIGLILFGLVQNTSAQTIYGLTNSNTLVTFDAKAPAIIQSTKSITGISMLETIVGMDVRPNTGEIYILGYDAPNKSGQLYVLNPTSAVAAPVGSKINNLKLTGEIGFDFNPTVDRIRVLAQGNENYRLHPVTGAIVATDKALNYKTGDPNEGKNPAIGTCAYTNSFIGSTSTALYDYDDSLNVFSIQAPPNDGVLTSIGNAGNSKGKTDMDIYYDVILNKNTPYLVGPNGNGSALYTIDLTNGNPTLIGNIGVNVAVYDIALEIPRQSVTPAGQLVYALNANNFLLSFYSASPTNIIKAQALSGITPGQTIVGLDYRPLDKKLYALGYNSTSKVARLYSLEPTTGVLTTVGADSIVGINLSGNVSMDFNPVVDRIRVVTSANKNYRLNPIDGKLAATDLDLKYKTGDANELKDPTIGAAAYTNSFAGATTTGLYVYDDSLNILASQNPPNDGTLTTIGSSNGVLSLNDLSSDLDIFYDFVTSTNLTYLCANVGGSFDALYTVDIATGNATKLGNIGNGIAIRDIAIQMTGGLGNSDIVKHTDLTVYPNPVKNDLNIEIKADRNAEVQIMIYSIQGQLLLTQVDNLNVGSNKIMMNLSGFDSGIYFVKVMQGGQNIVTQLFVK